MSLNLDALRLVLITDGSAAQEPPGAPRLLAVIAAALRGGATAVMLREKDLPPDRLARLAADALALTRAAGAWLIVNHAVDVALAVGADAVHLGWRSEPLESVRARTGARLAIGLSTHSPQDVADAARRGADYVTFGPVFPTPSKEGLVAAQGLAGLRAARAAADEALGSTGDRKLEDGKNRRDGGAAGDLSPTDAIGAPEEGPHGVSHTVGGGCLSRLAIVGLGGIDEPRAASVIRAGADGIAVMRALTAAADPETAARRLLARVAEGHAEA